MFIWNDREITQSGLAGTCKITLFSSDQPASKYLHMHGFKCKLSIENNVLVLNPKLSPLAQGVSRPPVMAD